MAKEVNLWVEIGNLCLNKALKMLKAEDIPDMGVVEGIEALVGIAVSIDTLNLRWEQAKNQSWPQAFDDRPSSRFGEES